MCTLSLTPLDDGFIVAMNRDERRTRPLGAGVLVHELPGRRVVHPTDAEAGGTWFGASSAGFVVALLNNYAADDPFMVRPLSRGLVTTHLLEAPDAADARARLLGLDLSLYRPFRAVVLDPASGVTMGESDGARLRVEEAPFGPWLLISSGIAEATVRAWRQARFRAFLDERPERAPSPVERVRALHFEEHPTDSALGFSMSRFEARSVSYTEVEARGPRWTLRHQEAPPVNYTAETGQRLAHEQIPVTEPA